MASNNPYVPDFAPLIQGFAEGRRAYHEERLADSAQRQADNEAARVALEEKGQAARLGKERGDLFESEMQKHADRLARGDDPKAADLQTNTVLGFYPGMPKISSKMVKHELENRHRYDIKIGDNEAVPFDPVGHAQQQALDTARVTNAIGGGKGYAPAQAFGAGGGAAAPALDAISGGSFGRPPTPAPVAPVDNGALRSLQIGGYVAAPQLPDTDRAAMTKSNYGIPMRSQYDESALGLPTELDHQRMRRDEQNVVTDPKDPYSAALQIAVAHKLITPTAAIAIAQSDDKRALMALLAAGHNETTLKAAAMRAKHAGLGGNDLKQSVMVEAALQKIADERAKEHGDILTQEDITIKKGTPNWITGKIATTDETIRKGSLKPGVDPAKAAAAEADRTTREQSIIGSARPNVQKNYANYGKGRVPIGSRGGAGAALAPAEEAQRAAAQAMIDAGQTSHAAALNSPTLKPNVKAALKPKR